MKLPRSSYKVLRMLILGYLHQGGPERRPATREQIVRSTGVNEFDVSRNSRALVDLGFTEREKGGSYRFTPEGAEVARAMEFEEPELTKRSLGPLLMRSETISSALNNLRVRGEMSTESFLNHLAMASQEPKSSQVLTGARAVLDLLAAGGLVESMETRYVPRLRRRVWLSSLRRLTTKRQTSQDLFPRP